MVMSIGEFAQIVASENTAVTDVPASPDWRFEVGPHGLELGGMQVGALPLYQVKSMVGSGVDIRNYSGTIREAQLNGERGEKGRTALRLMAHQLNGDLDRALISPSASGLDPANAIARTFLDEGGVVHIGGVVSRGYQPVRHLELVEAIEQSKAFDSAQVVKADVNTSHLEAFVMFDGAQWKVDGGLKAGIKIHNGQFGDKSYGYSAMLFRLMCTNGMMRVHAKMGVGVRRHTGGLDIAQDVRHSLEQTEELYRRIGEATSTPVPVFDTLIDLHRRGAYNRSTLKEAVARRHDLGGGGDGGDDLWSLAQAISAAARKYSAGQYGRMATLSGRLLTEGLDPVVKSLPLKADAPSLGDVMEYLEAA
jgi:hypothetical protein